MYFRADKKNSKNVSIYDGISYDKEGNEVTILDVLKTADPDFAEEIHKNDNIKLLKEYMKVLNKREKEVYIMPKIIPIKDLKNTSDISEMCHRTDEPIYITKNGYGDMVIMSMENYERMLRRLKVYEDILASEKQIEEGRVKDAKSSLTAMRKQYGL